MLSLAGAAAGLLIAALGQPRHLIAMLSTRTNSRRSSICRWTGGCSPSRRRSASPPASCSASSRRCAAPGRARGRVARSCARHRQRRRAIQVGHGTRRAAGRAVVRAGVRLDAVRPHAGVAHLAGHGLRIATACWSPRSICGRTGGAHEAARLPMYQAAFARRWPRCRAWTQRRLVCDAGRRQHLESADRRSRDSTPTSATRSSLFNAQSRRTTSGRWARRFSPAATSPTPIAANRPPVTIVNEAFAKKFYRRRRTRSARRSVWERFGRERRPRQFEIVGLVADREVPHASRSAATHLVRAARAAGGDQHLNPDGDQDARGSPLDVAQTRSCTRSPASTRTSSSISVRSTKTWAPACCRSGWSRPCPAFFGGAGAAARGPRTLRRDVLLGDRDGATRSASAWRSARSPTA